MHTNISIIGSASFDDCTLFDGDNALKLYNNCDASKSADSLCGVDTTALQQNFPLQKLSSSIPQCICQTLKTDYNLNCQEVGAYRRLSELAMSAGDFESAIVIDKLAKEEIALCTRCRQLLGGSVDSLSKGLNSRLQNKIVSYNLFSRLVELAEEYNMTELAIELRHLSSRELYFVDTLKQLIARASDKQKNK
jgi:hypothetical protein